MGPLILHSRIPRRPFLIGTQVIPEEKGELLREASSASYMDVRSATIRALSKVALGPLGVVRSPDEAGSFERRGVRSNGLEGPD